MSEVVGVGDETKTVRIPAPFGIFFLLLLLFCLNNISYNIRSKSIKSSYRELMQFTMPNRQRGNRTKKKHSHTRKKLIETVGQGYK